MTCRGCRYLRGTEANRARGGYRGNKGKGFRCWVHSGAGLLVNLSPTRIERGCELREERGRRKGYR